MPYIITRKTVNNNEESSVIKKKKYELNDLGSVYTHYDPETCKNVATENKLCNNRRG